MMIDDIEGPLDLEHAEAEEFLEGIQGNIIKGHGRDFTRHVLLRMTGDGAAVRRWIVRFATEQVTSAAAQLRSTRAWRAQGGPGEPFAMFLLSPDGYRHLGFADDRLPTPTDRFNPSWGDRYFPLGMKRQREITQRRYNDPPSNQWDAPYQGRIDAMVLLADDDRNRLEESVAAVLESIPRVFEKLTVESGRAIKQQFPEPRGELVIEHFGFQDGVSQPIMIQQDLDRELRQRGSTYWNPIAPLSLALVREPGGGLGSFMVFRKLEQDVKAFWEALTKLSNQTNIALETAGAMAVGRFPNGAPAVPTSTIAPKVDPNDFQYGLDPRGERCPFHAHIRKTNPRGDLPYAMAARPRPRTVTTEFERARRIVRRGITYGDRPDLRPGSTLDKPSQGVGLLFMCFQANLDQFVIQQEGSDSNIFVRDGTGFDAVIGQFHGPPDDPAAPIDQTWPSTATSDTNKFKMVNFVRMRGGEYFFAPSMSFLKELGQS
jgi:Dyp-type peroxidase family